MLSDRGRKNCVSTFLILFSLFFPSVLLADKISIKMSWGIFAGGGVQESLSAPEQFRPYISVGSLRKAKLGLNFQIEFSYQIDSRFSISLDGGYTDYSVKGRSVEYLAPYYEDYYNVVPEFQFQAIPVCLSLIFSVPMNSYIQVNVLGGLGYYIGTFESKSLWDYTFPGYPVWQERTLSHKGHSTAIGLHFGGGFDIALSDRIFFLSIDVRYRIVKFRGIDELEVHEVRKPIEFFPPELEKYYYPDFNYDVSKIDLAGIVINIGAKFKF